MKKETLMEKDVDIMDRLYIRSQTEQEKLKDKIDELAGISIPSEDRPYMIWFSALCKDAGSIIGEDRQFLMSRAVPEYSETGELIGAHEELETDQELLPTIGGQVFSAKTAVKLGKYLARKLGKTIDDIEKELKES